MRDITQLHPDLQKLIPKLIEKCKEQGISIKISECLRTVSEQNALYAQGRTKPGSIVTYARGSNYSSMHQWGVAFDFYLDMDIDGDGKKSDDAFNNVDRTFQKVGKIGKELGLEWGGDWKQIVDLPHFQLPDWGSTTTLLKLQYKTPENFFKTWKDYYDFEMFVKDLQAATGAKRDGIPGPETLDKTITVSMYKNRKHKVVEAVQKYLNKIGYNCGAVDGIAGIKFDSAVKAFQKDNGCIVDGEITAEKKTWKKLLKLE